MKNQNHINLFSLKEKTILITGAGGFLASKFIPVLLDHGARLILLDKFKKNISNLLKKYNKNYQNQIFIYELDITDEKNVEIVCKKIKNKFSSIDGLINNAAHNPKIESLGSNFKNSSFENFALENWTNDLAVSLTGSFLMTKYFGFLMSQNKKGGVILNISSDLGVIAPDQRIYEDITDSQNNRYYKPVSYSVVKSGLIGLTRYTATYWPEQIRCNVLCPGGIENHQDKNFLKKVSEKIPIGRLAKNNELNGIIIFLLSDASSYMTGAIINVDGGRSTW